MIILGTNSIKDTGYDVANSCIFDRASTDSMSKSMSDGSSIKGTFSAWIKVDGTGNEMNILSHFQDTNNVFTISTSGSGVNVVDYNSGYSLQLSTNRLMRDPSAWFHLYVAIDRSQGTADNRNRMFINGVEETSFSSRTNYSQQTSGGHEDAISMNDGQCTMYLGGLGDGNQMFGGYLAELHWIDGTVPAVTEFGEFDEDSEIWKPKLVSGISYGTNGFYLDFQDASNLGNDANGGTDLTESNIASTNQSTDTCTNNFATLNPLQTDHSGNTSFSEGNNKFQATTGDWVGTASTQGTNTGKWYAEFKLSTLTTSALIGVATDVYMSDRGVTDFVGFTSGLSNYAYAKYLTGVVDANEGKIRDQSQTYNSYGSNTGGSTGDIIGVALDLDNNKLYFSVNGTWENSGDPAGNSNGYTIGAGTYQFGVWGYQSTSEANFGSPPFTISSGNTDANGYGNFEYAVPSGYFSLNTKNLAEYG